MSATTFPTSDVITSDRALGPNVPQRLGQLLWAPMLGMALMAFPAGFALAVYRAALVAPGGSAATDAALGHLVPALMFTGFASVFAAITFAIARILGVLRTGGGDVQETARRRVLTLRMPAIAKLFIALMAMGMMIIVAAVVVHVVIAIGVLNGTIDLATARAWAEGLEGARRFGASTYLASIALGLGSIFTVLGFQASRIRQLPAEPRRA